MLKGTTICGVQRGGRVAIAGDGQVTMGESTIFKGSAVKVRRICEGRAIMGFAGSVADAFSLSQRFEEKMEQYGYNLMRAAVELAQEWRGDKVMRRLEAMMIVADREGILVVSGTGEVIAPDDGVCAIGSGGNYALSAARALVRHTGMNAREIAEESLRVAASVCVFTNENITIEEI
ncbi:MAG: ATP-dependent protease subunit HslV [Clostridia bacterium]|nr:ATP-dependent protease subunit HslV [Clostridia bacterium]